MKKRKPTDAVEKIDDGVKTELVGLKNSHDDLRAEQVVDYARSNVDSALYALFERNQLWDDSVAAEKMRVHYARMLMTRVKLTVVDAHGEQCQVRMFVNLSEARKDGTSYLYRQQVLTDETRLRMFLEDAAADIESIVRRYRDVLEDDWLSTLRQLTQTIRAKASQVVKKRKGRGRAVASAAR